MFDLEKARQRGLGGSQIDIMRQINENNAKEESCRKHEFERDVESVGFKYRCKNCGCIENVSFVKGYLRGLEHAGNKE